MTARQDRLDPLTSLLAAALLAAGCGGDHSRGERHEPPEPPVFEEYEPNDSPFYADFIGGVDSFSHFYVEGHVQAWGHDLYDHFEFVADEPLGVEFWLDAWNWEADIDLCLVDPDTGEVLACYDSPHGYESGYFTVDWQGRHFVLMVETWGVDTGYTLEIAGSTHPGYGSSDADDPPIPEATAETGISFPDGRPDPEKDEHRRGAPPRDVAPAPERLALRRQLEG